MRHAVEFLSNLAKRARAAIPVRRKLIATLAELDEQLAMLAAAEAVSDDELRRGFSTFRMKFPLELPRDADSAAYRDVQMKFYEWLHGKPYDLAHEGFDFDLTAVARAPFPFSTESAVTVGNQLMAIGHLIKVLSLPPKSTVLEFGPGWGTTTVCLARMGHRVTAVDINKQFLDLIQLRARQKNLEVETIQDDFSVIDRLERRFDAILFFECFHHSADHQGLVAALDRRVAPGGKVVFAAEPITNSLPMPWGLRLDGESLWAIRKHGWLELGFQEKYFRKLLRRHGWRVTRSRCRDTPWGVTFVARRLSES